MTQSSQRVVLVTGASRGIGRAIACEFGRSGHYVIINYRAQKDAADETLRLVREAGGEGETSGFDVTDADATEAALKELLARHSRLDALVNNAGTLKDGLFAMMSEADWRSVIDTSLNGFFHVTRQVIPKMILQRSGAIVNISSMAGLLGNRGQANYAAAKAGLIGATKALASEVARLGIRVNAVAPGLIETEMMEKAPVDIIKRLIPMNRVGQPEEVARVVRFLCSDDASYVTGQVIAINGGMA